MSGSMDNQIEPVVNALKQLPNQDNNAFSHIHQHTLCQELWNLQTEGLMCDVVIVINGERLYAHRVILSASSPHLKNLCVNPHIGLISPEGLVQIKVDGFPYKVCLRVLEFLYTGKQVDLDGEALANFTELCEQWGINPTSISEGSKDEPINSSDCSQVIQFPNLLTNYKVEQTDIVDADSDIDAAESNPVICITDPTVDVSSRTGGAKAPNITGKRLRGEAVQNPDEPPAKQKAKSKRLTAKKLKPARKDKKQSPAATKLFPMKKNNVIYDTESDTDIDDNDRDDQAKSDSAGQKPASGNPNYNKKDSSGTAPKAKQSKRIPIVMNDEGMYECPWCFESYDAPEKLKQHKREGHKNKGAVWCKLCKLYFADKNQLKAHNVEHHWVEGMDLPTQYTCQVEGCNYQTYIRKSFSSHKAFVHQRERSICDLCGKSLKSELSLKQHKKLVHVIQQSKEFPCEQCERVFYSYSGRQRHLVNEHNEGGGREKHICPHCGTVCFDAPTLNDHLFKKHDVPPPPGKTAYQCKHCDFKTLRVRQLHNHEARHNAEKKFSCEICGRAYPTPRELNRHLHLHTDKCKTWSCPQCPYTTKYSAAALRSHIQVKHEDNRPWSCHICTYSTKLKGNLHKHIRNVHKCEVQTRWTIPKLCDGTTTVTRYTNSTATGIQAAYNTESQNIDNSSNTATNNVKSNQGIMNDIQSSDNIPITADGLNPASMNALTLANPANTTQLGLFTSMQASAGLAFLPGYQGMYSNLDM